MNNSELERLLIIEKRIKEIAEEFGLLTTEIIFEVVPAQRMLEGMAYHFPTNISHWSFGRDYEKYRTIYEQTGQGIPYEQVWNFDLPRALIVETAPFALKVLTIAHVYGHVDFYLGNRYLKTGRSFSNVAEEARNAAIRFREYEAKYGKEEVEKTIDAAMSICDQTHPDLFFEEELDNELAKEKLLAFETAKLERAKDFYSEFKRPETQKEIEKIEKRLKRLSGRVPPKPIYDLLGYIIRYSPILKLWQRDVLTVIRNQRRALAFSRATKTLNEGWATYWHLRIIRKLFEEKLLSEKEHGTFNDFHSAIVQENKTGFNWYRIGLSFFEHLKKYWDTGRFGEKYEECKDPVKKAYWDIKTNKGTEKIFEIRSFYNDRMAIEAFFDDEFIKILELYLYEEDIDPQTGEIIFRIIEDNPEIIRQILKQSLTFGVQPIVIKDADYQNHQELYLVHYYYGLELEPLYRNGALEHIYYLWGKEVHLETIVEEKNEKSKVIFSFNGKKHKIFKVKKD